MTKNCFYIKTLEIRDKFCKSLSETGPILVEQVFGDFDQVRLYDTSYIQNQEKLYFFKRHFQTPEDLLENGLEEVENEWDHNNPQGFHMQNSCLFLHEYDFKNQKEKIVQEIFFRESDESAMDSENNGSRRYSKQSVKDSRMTQSQYTRKPQYNLTFSKQFG